MIYKLGSSSLFASGNDAYIVGFQLNNTARYSTSPLYWKNEIATILPDLSGDAFANSIFISNNDIYVAGIANYFTDTFHVPYTTPSAEYPKIGNLATIWKNGVAAILPGYHSIGLTGGGQYAVSMYADYESSLFVSGNDVYVAGGSRYWGNNARYWKNGVPTDLSKEMTYKAVNGTLCYPTTTSISASGNDVYVAGYQLTSTNKATAIYWKNGEVVNNSTCCSWKHFKLHSQETLLPLPVHCAFSQPVGTDRVSYEKIRYPIIDMQYLETIDCK